MASDPDQLVSSSYLNYVTPHHSSLVFRSLIDLNRAGVPLMELVFEPDLSDGEEAAALVKELCLILTRLQTCNCRMEGRSFSPTP